MAKVSKTKTTKTADKKQVSKKATSKKATPAKAASKKATPKKASATTPAAKKTVAKTAAKKSTAKKPAAKKTVEKKPAKKPAAKKTTDKKSVEKKISVKKAVEKKPAAKKSPAKKSTEKKPAAKKPAVKKSSEKANPKTEAVKKPAEKKSSTPKKRGVTIIANVRSKIAADGPLVTPYAERKGENYMNRDQIDHFIQILSDWKMELMEEVDRTVHHMKDESHNLPDPNDRASQEEEFSLELRTRDRERKLIRKIDKTLEAIKRDEYGYCEDCGIEIGIRRLEARPTATQCIDCKTLSELKEKQTLL